MFAAAGATDRRRFHHSEGADQARRHPPLRAFGAAAGAQTAAMSVLSTARPPWPVPALLSWLLAWVVFAATARAGTTLAGAAGLLAGLAAALTAQGWRRRLIAGAGFPLSALALGVLPALPPWAWLTALLPLLLAYPPKAWRDAPFFPTSDSALDGVEAVIELAAGARVLDAGCGIGHGLAALQRRWPQARIEGIEWSRPLAWLAARRCPNATVTRGDMWAVSWAGCALVYLFQRPESMAPAVEKARREMPGGWLVSLEFEVPGVRPLARLGARPLWIYRIEGSTTTATGR